MKYTKNTIGAMYGVCALALLSLSAGAQAAGAGFGSGAVSAKNSSFSSSSRSPAALTKALVPHAMAPILQRVAGAPDLSTIRPTLPPAFLHHPLALPVPHDPEGKGEAAQRVAAAEVVLHPEEGSSLFPKITYGPKMECFICFNTMDHRVSRDQDARGTQRAGRDTQHDIHGKNCIILTCGHYGHFDCFFRALLAKPECPMCRTKLSDGCITALKKLAPVAPAQQPPAVQVNQIGVRQLPEPELQRLAQPIVQVAGWPVSLPDGLFNYLQNRPRVRQAIFVGSFISVIGLSKAVESDWLYQISSYLTSVIGGFFSSNMRPLGGDFHKKYGSFILLKMLLFKARVEARQAGNLSGSWNASHVMASLRNTRFCALCVGYAAVMSFAMKAL